MRPPAGTPDVSVLSFARVGDHLIGGKNALQADRDAVDQMSDTFPGWRGLALMQRRFLARARRPRIEPLADLRGGETG